MSSKNNLLNSRTAERHSMLAVKKCIYHPRQSTYVQKNVKTLELFLPADFKK